jgi:hypothetical protein
MTGSPRPLWWRASAAGISIALALCFSGCVYLRLLQLKLQLANFDRNFALVTDRGLQLRSLEPVLLASDIRWLGFEPASTRRSGNVEQWTVRWVTQPADKAADKGSFEIAFELSFTDGRLSAFTLAEKYFSLLPMDVVVATIKSLGSGKVDRKGRSMKSTVAVPPGAASAAWPDRNMIAAILGPPTEEHREANRIRTRFVCVSADPGGKGKNIEITLVFDAVSEKLLQAAGRLPVGNIDLDFTSTAAVEQPSSAP